LSDVIFVRDHHYTNRWWAGDEHGRLIWGWETGLMNEAPHLLERCTRIVVTVGDDYDTCNSIEAGLQSKTAQSRCETAATAGIDPLPWMYNVKGRKISRLNQFLKDILVAATFAKEHTGASNRLLINRK
jgi:hypothetical protein